MSLARRLMEPRCLFDRILYALQTVFLPYVAAVAVREGLEFSGMAMIACWVIFSFYTIEWLLEKLVD